MDNQKIKNVNRILSMFVLIFSPFFIYLTLMRFKEDGGPMGFGYLILPLFVIYILFVILAIISLFKNNTTNKFYFVINIIGSIYTILLLTLLI
jgi:hypothetical protein